MPKEEAVQPFDRGSIQEVQLSTGSEKNDIVFYDLEEQEIVHRARPADWDIEFTEDGLKINPFREMRYAAVPTGVLAIKDTVGLAFTTGQFSANQWTMHTDSQYVLVLSVVGQGSHLGFYKLKLSENNGLYTLHYAKLIEENWSIASLEEMEYFNLRTGSEVDLPSANSYDIVFGKYIHYFAVEQVFYEVFGALHPSAASSRNASPFTGIDAAAADTAQWQTERSDGIGFDWKSYNLQKGAYEIDEEANFLLRNRNGFIYKFRFTSFYDLSGQSGHPTFEYQLL